MTPKQQQLFDRYQEAVRLEAIARAASATAYQVAQIPRHGKRLRFAAWEAARSALRDARDAFEAAMR